MSRKYKQSGYLEKGAPSERRPSTGPRPRREGPRGRGLGAPSAPAFRCARCGHREPRYEPPETAPPVEAVCGECGSELHTCTHCAHFDTSSRFECRREIPRRIGKKDARNECELFEVKLVQEFAAEAESPRDARAAFDDLFNL